MDKDYKVEIINEISNKTGNPYKCIEVTIYTAVGAYTFRNFPSPLEMSIIERTLAKSKAIYGEEDKSLL